MLLFAYPAKFQREYGLQMVQVFRDCCLCAATFFLFFALAHMNEVQRLSGNLEALYSFSHYAFLASPFLLAVGLLGLRSRRGESVGGFGKGVLLLGALAGAADHQLAYLFPAALGGRYVSCDPDPIKYAGLEYAPKIKLQREGDKSGGGCG